MDTPVFEARAIQRHLRRAPRKVRLVADAVRGSQVSKALKRLEFTNKGSAGDVAKVIKSAAANLRDKFQEERFDNDDLIIKTIFVDEGVTLKRIQPAPQGRAHRINKRSCHITVVVAKREEELVNE
ncbi:MAG: 50S ribosomal protein L22 [Balneolaceae bacterium]|jgi:large subunit ribosomal protein L22|nr:50S ribosomal protein L22 [Balneolaceae bacterium]MBO6795414.1 50S ribosomal protein L22 [Balneolaceae bacterium]MCR9134108.1 50S ribosomal protein L22 [bacterium]|mmetsp:Transcript_22558/g.73323  ORF Transcript_22558/g.73323 Transcript_22558/m.73323 type:complete len:126 (-) Transcript_22558:1624-2001(-)